MAIFESRAQREARLRSDILKYPELDVATYDEIARTDAVSRSQGQRVTQFGRDTEDVSARIGFAPEEVSAIERFSAQRDEDNPFGGPSGISPRFQGLPPSPLISSVPERQRERARDGGGDGGIFGTSFGAGFDLDLGALGGGIKGAPAALAGRTAGAFGRLGELGQELMPGGAASQVVNRPNVFDPETREAARRIEDLAPAPFEAIASLSPIASANTLTPEGRIDHAQAAEAALAGVSGLAFFEALTRTVTGGGAGLEEIGISPDEMNPLARELLDALAPINFAAAGVSPGISASIRAAGAAKPAPVRLALGAVASAIEPFANASFEVRLGREIAVDVVAQEAFRQTEGQPQAVRFAAALAGGAVAGALTDPRVAQGLANIPAGIREAGDANAIFSADPTAVSRAAGELPRGSVLPVVDPDTGGARGVRRVAGAAEESTENTQLDAAREALRSAYVDERNIRGRGIPQEELRAGRAGQARGVEDSLNQATDAGLSGEDLVRQAQSGAAVPGGIRETFAEPVELTSLQRNAVYDDLARRMRDGEIDSFEFLNTARGVDRLISGEGLRQFEIDNPVLRSLVGDEVVNAVGRRGPRETLDRADAAIRRETDRFIQTAENAQRRAAETRQRADLRVLDAQIKALEEPIDITTGTGARAVLANPDVEDVFRARREVDLLAQRAETRAQRAVDTARTKEIDARIKELETKRTREIAAFNRADEQEIARLRRELDAIAERDARRALRSAEAESVRDVTARTRELETLHRQQLRAANEADAAIRRETERFNQQAVSRQLNARNVQEARAFRNGARLREALDSSAPNSEILLNRASAVMDKPVIGTPPGEVPRGASGGIIGDRAVPPTPRVPVEMREEALIAMDHWLNFTDAYLKPMGDEGLPLVGAIKAQITGQLDSPYLTGAVYRRNILTSTLRSVGVDDATAKQIADVMFDEQLARRLGDGFSEIRAARPKARAAVRNGFRSQRLPVPEGAEFDKLVGEQLDEMFSERYGRRLLSQERRVNEQLGLMQRNQSLDGVRQFVQESKNTMFGLTDFAVLGIQLPTAIMRGGVGLMAKMINDLLAVMHLPNARYIYTEGALPKQIQYMIDGVDQSSRAASFQATDGSLLRYVPLVKKLDPLYMRASERMAEIQYGTILGAVRNASYEGNLVMAHLLRQDVTDPVVRAAAAANANHVGSSATAALRGNRATAEDILVTSARMTRARFNNITEMAKVFQPGATQAERIMGASTIASSMFFTLVIGQYINDLIGISDFEIDPSKPGFGLITVPGIGGGENRVVDLVPQDSVTRAFARSLSELAQGNPEDAAEQWAKVYLGSSSIAGKVPTTLFGYGYEPGAGFRFGDLTPTGRVLNVAPLPPVVQELMAEGFDAMGLALESVGIGNFPEGTFGAQERILRDAGNDPDTMTSVERRQALADLGELMPLEERRISELEELKARGDRTATALLLSSEKRDELNRIYEEEREGGSKASYRDRRSDVQVRFLGRSDEYDDIFRGFGESDNEAQRLAGQRYELRDQATTGTELDFDVLEELEAEFDAALDPTQREAVLAVINAVDPRDNPWEQEYDTLRVELADAGWWDIKDIAWASGQFAAVTGFASAIDAADDFITRIEGQAIALGLPPGRAREEALEGWQSSDVKQSLDELVRLERERWVTQSLKRAELADQMLEWGIWDNVTSDVEQYLDSVLITP